MAFLARRFHHHIPHTFLDVLDRLDLIHPRPILQYPGDRSGTITRIRDPIPIFLEGTNMFQHLPLWMTIVIHHLPVHVGSRSIGHNTTSWQYEVDDDREEWGTCRRRRGRRESRSTASEGRLKQSSKKRSHTTPSLKATLIL